MFSKALFAALVGSASAAFSISTPPSLVQCQPASLSWSGSDSTPFILAAIPGGQPAAPAIANIASTSSSPYAWTVNVASGTTITIKVTDGQGNIAYSSEVTVQPGPSNSCLSATSGSGSSGNSSVSAVAGSAGTGSSSTGAVAGGSAVTTTGAAAAGSSSGTVAAASGSNTAASSQSSKAAAGRSAVVGGALGAAGLVIAALA